MLAARGRSLALLGALTWGCARGRPTAVIGYAFPRWGEEAVRAATDEVASWPSAHRPVIRIIYDTAFTSDPADVEVQRAQRFAAMTDLVGVVGHGSSRGSLVASPVYNEAGIPQIAPTSTSRLLHGVGPWTFMLAPDDSAEGAFMAAFAAERLGAQRISIFFVNDEYGAGLRDGVRAELQRRRVAVLDEVGFGTESDFAALVGASLRRGRPDVILVAGRQLATARIARAAESRAPGMRVVAGDGALVLPALTDAAGRAADSIYVVAFWLPDAPDSLSRAFVERFRRIASRVPQSSDAMSHDALMLLAAAVRDVGPSRVAIRDYLRELGRERAPYPGVTGPISFRPDRAPRLVMARLAHGVPVRVEAP